MCGVSDSMGENNDVNSGAEFLQSVTLNEKSITRQNMLG
jgi:hypothetical protein